MTEQSMQIWDDLHGSFTIVVEPLDTTKKEKTIIYYEYKSSALGLSLIARTEEGICYIGFDDDRNILFLDFSKRFKGFCLQESTVTWPLEKREDTIVLKLHLKGTPFQQKVWKALLLIDEGNTSHYGTIAKSLDIPKACRAVGTAVGANPVSVFIPCHRVLPANGNLGEYHWGKERKRKLLEWEKRRK